MQAYYCGSAPNYWWSQKGGAWDSKTDDACKDIAISPTLHCTHKCRNAASQLTSFIPDVPESRDLLEKKSDKAKPSPTATPLSSDNSLIAFPTPDTHHSRPPCSSHD
jgi:hypothetical protein